MNVIAIRRLQPDDAALAAQALGELKPAGERGPRPVCEVRCRSFLREERNTLVVALSDEKPVGYAIAYLLDRADREAPMLLLYEIEVTESRRGQGIGRAMVEWVKEVAQEHGAFKMWVLTDRANRAARGLYRSCGGAESGENLLIEWTRPDLETEPADGLAAVEDGPASSVPSCSGVVSSMVRDGCRQAPTL
jgi:GNAT superfamily N-acetyltransferase